MQSLEEWHSKWQQIKETNQVHGLVWCACILLWWLRLASISAWFVSSLIGIEWYVIAKVLLLLLIFIWLPDGYLLAASFLAGYLLFEMYLHRFTTILFGKFEPRIVAEPVSVERSLLLFVFNVAELTLAFAIFYRLALSLSPPDAIISSILAFGTVGYRKDASGLAAWQIVLDFLLVAIFLSTIVARISAHDRNERGR